jgi:hypothetical protein
MVIKDRYLAHALKGQLLGAGTRISGRQKRRGYGQQEDFTTAGAGRRDPFPAYPRLL